MSQIDSAREQEMLAGFARAHGQVAWAQAMLARAGFLTGSIDGCWDQHALSTGLLRTSARPRAAAIAAVGVVEPSPVFQRRSTPGRRSRRWRDDRQPSAARREQKSPE